MKQATLHWDSPFSKQILTLKQTLTIETHEYAGHMGFSHRAAFGSELQTYGWKIFVITNDLLIKKKAKKQTQ